MGNLQSDSTSLSEEIPPDAIIGVLTADRSSFKAEMFGPCNMPSLEMSVKIIAQGIIFSISFAKATDVNSLNEVHPFTATLPFFASIPIAIRPGNFAQSSSTHEGESIALDRKSVV